ncbi:MAG: hypothetical protein ACTSU6_06110 [Candidatus Njordarchaeales archaeon]
MTQKESLNKIFKKYGLLRSEHIYKDGEFTIINRQGIMKIKQIEMLNIQFKLVFTDGETKAVVRARTIHENIQYQTFGEASKNNNTFPYPVSIAEKRALSRLVLEVCGLYYFNIKGEGEVDNSIKKEEIKKSQKNISDSVSTTMGTLLK